MERFIKSIRTFIVISAVFLLSRLLMLSSIVFIKTGPLSPDTRSFKWAATEAVIHIPHRFSRVLLNGSCYDTQDIQVYLNNNHVCTLTINEKPSYYFFDTGGCCTEGNNELRLCIESISPLADNSSKAWKLWDIRTDADISCDILKSQNLLFSQQIKTAGLSRTEHTPGRTSLEEVLRIGLSKWDANIYSRLLESGYEYDGDNTVMHNIVFPYLYPLASYAAYRTVFNSPLWSGVAVNNLMFFIAMFFFYRISKIITGSEYKAVIPVILLAFNPFGVFLLSAFSEGMFILFLLICINLLHQKKYALFSLFAGALSAIRVVGIIAPLVFITDYFLIQKNKPTVKSIFKTASLSIASAWGIVTFMAYSGLKFNDFAAMFRNQQAWTPGSPSPAYLLKHVVEPLLNAGNFMEPRILGMGTALFILALCAVFIIRNRKKASRLEYILAVFSVLLMLVPMVFYSRAANIHDAMGRYTLVAYPSVALACKNLHGFRLASVMLWVAFSVFGLVLMTMRYAWGLTPY